MVTSSCLSAILLCSWIIIECGGRCLYVSLLVFPKVAYQSGYEEESYDVYDDHFASHETETVPVVTGNPVTASITLILNVVPPAVCQ